MKKYFFIILIMVLLPLSSVAKIANHARLEYNKGVDYYKLGQYEKAAQKFRSAINISPDFIDAYYNLGSIFEYLEQYEQALSMFQQIILRNPDDYEAVYKAAYVAYKLNRYEDAVSYISIIPKSSSQYSLSRQLISKINSEKFQSPKKISKAVSDNYSMSTSYLYEGIQGPTGMAIDNFGNLYVACYSDNAITKIYPDGRKIVYTNDKKINGPIGLVIDELGNLYIANYLDNNILKIKNNGDVSIVVANISKPYGLYLKDKMLYISSQGSNSILRYKLTD